jgi:hypothetical protein
LTVFPHIGHSDAGNILNYPLADLNKSGTDVDGGAFHDKMQPLPDGDHGRRGISASIRDRV